MRQPAAHHAPNPTPARRPAAEPGPGRTVQRLVMDDVSKAWRGKDKHWEAYRTWFNIKGEKAVTEALLPMKDLEELRQHLDLFGKTEKTDYTQAELNKLALQRDFGGQATFQLLVAGIDTQAAPALQLGRLLDNFRAQGKAIFDYTMASTDSTKFLAGTVGGDCNTVVRTFKLLANNWLGLPADYKTSASLGFAGRFTAAKATTIDGKTGNVDGGASWLFDNHYWIEAGGVQYDVLFGKTGLDTSSWVKEDPPNSGTFGKVKIKATGKVSPIADRYLSDK